MSRAWNNKKLSKEEKFRIGRLLRLENSCRSISKETGRSVTAISRYAHQQGIKIRRPGFTGTPEEVRRHIFSLIDQGCSCNEVVEKTGICYPTVYTIVKKERPEALGRRGGKPPALCKIWHEGMKSQDQESLFKDLTFMEETFPKSLPNCHDYRKIKSQKEVLEDVQ
jgi:hypothetical protein